MTMTMLTILQLLQIFVAYTCITVCVPALILHRHVKNESLSIRCMIYFMTGNFYIMNLIFLLQLLHISNRITVILFTVVPAAILFVICNKIPVVAILRIWYTHIRRLSEKKLGRKTFVLNLREWMRSKLQIAGRWAFDLFVRHFIQCVLFAGLIALILWMYGSNALINFGYEASDIPVHNYWINAMDDNQIFVAGVYPFGFHCVIYYLHSFFNIDVYVLLRLFCVIQTLYIHLMLLCFIKAVTKSAFLPYLGVGMYVAVNIFRPGCTSRYISSLPQEFGMIFILPSIWFAISFFLQRKKEIDACKIDKDTKEKTLHLLSTRYLALYAICFGMTLAVHFYDTMIAGLFCVALAIGFCFRFFRKGYFGRVLLAMFAGIFIAVIPMAAAYAMGTPLQGSLNWGMNVITGADEEDTESVTDTEISTEMNEEINTGTETLIDTTPHPDTESSTTTPVQTDFFDEAKNKIMAITAKIQSVGSTLYQGARGAAFDGLFENHNEAGEIDEFYNYFTLVVGSMLLMTGLGVLFFFLRRTDYAAILISVVCFFGFMFLLLESGKVGLPELMDNNRSSIFMAYSLPILFTLLADAVLYLVLDWVKGHWAIDLASLLVCVITGSYLVMCGPIREPLQQAALETNGAIITLANIFRDNKDHTWTIVSANDELRMSEARGYHYETITFLRQQEGAGANARLTFPTRYVYIYVEKIPGDYFAPYEGSGQSVSRAGAAKALPLGNGLEVYEGENRWIVMSRMYYWAQQFTRLYPNDVIVYYEDDEFICYRIEQNEYSLYNFAIDYEYNMMIADQQ